MASSSKGKNVEGGKQSDWRLLHSTMPKNPTSEMLATLDFPFHVDPEPRDSVPKEFTMGVNYLKSIDGNVPWDGYYARYKKELIPVTNVYGAWCEVRKRHDKWEAFRFARPNLGVRGSVHPEINTKRMLENQEAYVSRPSTPANDEPTQESTPPQVVEEPEHDSDIEDVERGLEYGAFAVRSSTTELPPRRPRGTGDDPMTLADARSDKNDYLRLEGTPPDRFDGNRERTLRFLTQFKRFMLMNDGATISRNPIKRCAYFLSLIEGSKVEGWTDRSYEWLDKVQNGKTTIPFDMTAWEVLERDFRNAFVDYAEHERAADDLKRLKMKEGRIDEYIAAFERLGHRANADLDDPLNLRLFARGLPKALCDICIDIDSPETFEQWANAAQRHQRNWLRKQAIKDEYGSSQPPQRSNHQNQRRGNGFGNFYWRRGQGQGQQQSNRGSSGPARPRLPPRDDNAMDTSAAVRKASTDKDKEEYRKTGRCFECGKQGHLARVCPSKKPRQNARTVTIEDDNEELPSDRDDPGLTPVTLAALAMRLSDDDKQTFARSLQQLGADAGFQDA